MYVHISIYYRVLIGMILFRLLFKQLVKYRVDLLKLDLFTLKFYAEKVSIVCMCIMY